MIRSFIIIGLGIVAPGLYIMYRGDSELGHPSDILFYIIGVVITAGSFLIGSTTYWIEKEKDEY